MAVSSQGRVPLIVVGTLPIFISLLLHLVAVSVSWRINSKLNGTISSVRIFNYPYGMESKIDSIKHSTSYAHTTNQEVSVFCLLEKYSIKFPNIVLAQSLLETGYYLSHIFLTNFNLFGMKVSSRGYHIPTTSLLHKQRCGDAVHACYESIERSVQDYAEWQQVRMGEYEALYGKISNEEEYLQFLDNLVISGKPGYRYAEDKNYTRKLRKLIRNNECTPQALVEERLLAFHDTIAVDGKLIEIIYY